MKAQVSESMSTVEVDYESVPFKKEYTIDVIEFYAEVSITVGFEIDCQVTIEVAVESEKGVVILEGQVWFGNIAYTSQSKSNYIEIDDLSVKESRVDDSELEQFLQDISDSIVNIKFSA